MAKKLWKLLYAYSVVKILFVHYCLQKRNLFSASFDNGGWDNQSFPLREREKNSARRKLQRRFNLNSIFTSHFDWRRRQNWAPKEGIFWSWRKCSTEGCVSEDFRSKRNCFGSEVVLFVYLKSRERKRRVRAEREISIGGFFNFIYFLFWVGFGEGGRWGIHQICWGTTFYCVKQEV